MPTVEEEVANLVTATNNLISEVSTQKSNLDTSEANAAASAAAASTSEGNAATSLSTFTGQYVSQPTEPTSSVEGMLWFDEANDLMKVYDGSVFVNAGSSVNGTSERQTYIATAGQTTFNATYDAGYVDVYLNGIKLLDGTDFTATNGTTVVLASGATVNDVVDIVAYGTFELADHYTKVASDARYEPIDTAYTKSESDGQLATKADVATTYTKDEVNNKPSGFKNYIIRYNFD